MNKGKLFTDVISWVKGKLGIGTTWIVRYTNRAGEIHEKTGFKYEKHAHNWAKEKQDSGRGSERIVNYLICQPESGVIDLMIERSEHKGRARFVDKTNN